MTRTAARNSRHPVEQHVARWLLMSHDRAESDEFAMTHEFLSIMLSVRHAGGSVAAGAPRKARLIRYERSRIVVTDRLDLGNASCARHGIARHAPVAGPNRDRGHRPANAAERLARTGAPGNVSTGACCRHCRSRNSPRVFHAPAAFGTERA